MNQMIVSVRDKMLRRIGGVNHFVTHNKDYEIQFQFDDSWTDVRHKMAVFAYEDGEYGSEIFDGDVCSVPELPKEGKIYVGVKAGDELSTELLCVQVCKSADDVITDEYDVPDPKIYEQILDIMNNLWGGGDTVYPSSVKFLAAPSAVKVGDLIRVKEVDENGDVEKTVGFDIDAALGKKIDAPSGANAGEVLTVEEVDENGKPVKWKTTPGVDITTELSEESTDKQVPSAKAAYNAIQNATDKDAVRFVEQELTDAQKQQARENIGIKIAQKNVAGLVKAYDALDNYDMLRYNSLYVFSDGTSAVPREIPIISTEEDLNYSLWQGTLAGGVVNFEYTPFANAGLLYPCYLQRFTQTYPNDSKHYLSATYLITDLNGVQLVGNSQKDWMLSGSLSWKFSPFVNNASLVAPATAQSGQIIKVKSVDDTGKITEMESSPYPVFYVTITRANNVDTADKTLAEIQAAYNSGCSVFAVVGNFVLPLLTINDDVAAFCATTPDGEIHRMAVIITKSNVTVAFGSFVEGNQGVENAGKILGINDSGNVVPQDKPTFTLTEDEKAEIAGEVVADGVEVVEMDLPTVEQWELIKTIDVVEGAGESTTLTIDTDNNGNAFSLKKCRLFARFPAYTGETTIPNFSFGMLNGGMTGNAAPLCYTSGFPKLSTTGFTGTVWEVDVSGFKQYEKVLKSTTTWHEDSDRYGSNSDSPREYWGDKRVQSITSIGGAQMIIFPGCHFELYGVRT